MAVSEQTVVTGKQLDQLCINTIRTLSMDAVQKANSGHPGAPMGLAPVAYSLWQQFLRYDPEDPIWPNRDRFVLSTGHASMLLYSMLYLTGVRLVNAEGKVTRRLAVSLDDIKHFARLTARRPGIPNTHMTRAWRPRPARWARAWAIAWAWRSRQRWLAATFQSPGFRDFQLQRLRDLRRWRHDGRRRVAKPLRSPGISSSRICAGSTTTITSRSMAGGLVVQRRCDDAVRRLRLECHACERCQRSGRAGARPTTTFLQDQRPAHADHRQQPHRLRSPHKQDTNEAHGEALGEEEVKLTKKYLRLAGRCEVSGARRRAWRLSARASASAGAICSGQWNKLFARVHEAVSGSGRAIEAHAAPRTAGRMGQESARLSRRCERHGHARKFGQSSERHRAECSLADGRLGRSGNLEQDAL